MKAYMNKTLLKSLAIIFLLAFMACKSEGGNSDPNNPATPENQVRPASFANDDAMLDYIERVHFNYMWDGAEPISGMARERIHLDGDYPEHDQDVVTTGGSGFGIAGLVVAMERGFITRDQGVERLTRIVDFLERADRFHGVWSHWINGSTAM